MKKSKLIELCMLFFALAALVLSAGCGGRSESTQTGADNPSGQGNTARTVTGETADILDVRAGLDRLSSYRAVLTLKFEGSSAGQPQSWTQSHRLQYASGGEDFRINSIERNSSAAGASPSRRFMADVYGYRLELRDGEECTLSLPDPSLALDELWEPASQLLAVSGAQHIGTTSINGMEANHFSLDAAALGLDGLADASGEIWVDSTGGAILKYLLSVQAGSDYFGEGTEGTLSWSYELLDINQVFSPDLPAECSEATLVWLPILPGAEITSLAARSISFQTSLEPQQVLDYYLGRFETAGWLAAQAANPFDFFGDDSMGDYEDYDEDFGAENENYGDDFAYGDDWQDDSFFAPGGMDDPSVKTFTRGNQRLTMMIARESDDVFRVVIQLEQVAE